MGPMDHTRCTGVVRSIQSFHMDGNGWNDIAYNFLVCPHGKPRIRQGVQLVQHDELNTELSVVSEDEAASLLGPRNGSTNTVSTQSRPYGSITQPIPMTKTT